MAELKTQLATQEVELTRKNDEADKLIEIVGVETEKVSNEKASADEEELKVHGNQSEWYKPPADLHLGCSVILLGQ